MKAAKRLLLLLAVCLVSGVAVAQQTYVINLTWKNDSTPACTTTVKTLCVIGRTLTDNTVSGSPVVIAGPTVITASMAAFTTPPIPYTAPITRFYSMVTNFNDANGAAQVSSIVGTCGPAGTPGPCSVPVFIVLPPSNLTATPVQVSALVQSGDPAGMM